MGMKMLLVAENVSFGFPEKPVLQNISLTVHKGEIISLLGPNGSGKTTLLKTLLGLYQLDKGRVLFEGRSIASLRKKSLARNIAYVPQVHRASFAYRVIDVVLMGRIPHKTFFSRFSPADLEIALDSLDKLSILHLKDKPYTQISGGERQLTLIARAMTQEAHTFIMDEPANGLDYGNQIKLLEGLMDLGDEGYTFVKSTHFPDHALWIADRVIMLKEGSIIADGAPDDVITSENLFALYGREVNVHALRDNFKVCIPKKIGNGKRATFARSLNRISNECPLPLDSGLYTRQRRGEIL
jgi:iron complex transport system ATP-binding protein